MARVEVTSDAREDLRDLDRSARILILKALKKLETEPEKRGAPLGSNQGGKLTTFRKLVVGDRDYRVIYRVEADGTACVVFVIARRADNEAYELALSRLRLHGNRPLADQMAATLQEIWSLNR